MVKHFYIAIALAVSIVFLLLTLSINAQISFRNMIQLGAPIKNFGQSISDIAQDPRGFIWFTSRQGLHRYDGSSLKNYRHNPLDSNTLGFDDAVCIYIDDRNIIWIGSKGFGLDRFDPFLNSFTHFRHQPLDQASLSNDTVTSILKDSKGVIWIGTRNGLNQFDPHTSKFTAFFFEKGNNKSICDNAVTALYEDRNNILWIGCGSDDVRKQYGGLNRYNRKENNFTRYVHDADNASSIVNSGISALFEDSKGNFWVGTAGAGVQLMDRTNGSFSHWSGDKMHSGEENKPAHRRIHEIRFICEDNEEGIWIGSVTGGINRVFPGSNRASHFGTTFVNDLNLRRDTTEGFQHYYPWKMFSSKDGLLWVVTADGGMYTVNPFESAPKFYEMAGMSVISFLLEPGENVLWIGTNKGLVRRVIRNGNEKRYQFSESSVEFAGANIVNTMKMDPRGNLWIGTGNGLVLFDTATARTVTFRNDPGKLSSIAGNGIYSLMFDGEHNLWVGTDHGLDRMDLEKKEFFHYGKTKDPRSWDHVVYDLAVNQTNNDLWQGTSVGLEKISSKTGKIHRYMPNVSIWCVFIDSDHRIWATSSSGLFLYDTKLDRFREFLNPKSGERFYDIIDIIEDQKKFMWVRAPNEILRISPDKTEVRALSFNKGVRECNPHFDRFNIIDSKGRIYMVADRGFHRFHPNDFLTNSPMLPLVFTGLRVNNKEVKPGNERSILRQAVSALSRIELEYHQNDFSLEFIAFDYTQKQELTYQVKLDHYDKDWRQLGNYNKADYFNVRPGDYVLSARAMNNEGFVTERTLQVHINPPWWGTWWAFLFYILSFISLLGVFVRWRTFGVRKRNFELEQKVILRTQQLKAEKEKVELTLDELKTTQEQLILKEKMASLGEMTTGIAHEIQNPLNFVNNFSELNKELIQELKGGLETGSVQSVQEILTDLDSNTERVYFHGKRADQIVKSMLLFTRGGKGQKKPTDIVALADECMWRAYDAFKNKNNCFDACVNMDLKTEVGHHNLVPNDISRVLMNLYDNAFYAVHEKKIQSACNCTSFEPVVTVTAREEEGYLIISIMDNGTGIPDKYRDKIFQPFFTTKPTGQGAGLGLSLCYDIIKAHGGEIKVESQEGSGSVFYVIIPVSGS